MTQTTSYNVTLNTADSDPSHNKTFNVFETNAPIYEHQPLDFYFALGGGPINLSPHILSFNIVASNAKGCGINKNTTY